MGDRRGTCDLHSRYGLSSQLSTCRSYLGYTTALPIDRPVRQMMVGSDQCIWELVGMEGRLAFVGGTNQNGKDSGYHGRGHGTLAIPHGVASNGLVVASRHEDPVTLVCARVG